MKKSGNGSVDILRYFCILATVVIGMIAIIGSSSSGGGGGGTVVTAPTVVSTSPADTTSGIAIDSVLSVTFSEDMDPATITVTSLSIDHGVTGSVAYNSSTFTATFTPSASLAPNTTYTATVSSSCSDVAGNGLAADYVWTFKTGGPGVAVWTIVGGQVSPATAESEDPTMVIVSGSPAVGYREISFEANLNIWDGSSWGMSVPDPTNGNMNYTGYHAPSYCSDGTMIYLTYSLAGVSGGTTDEFYDRVFVRDWVSGGTWSTPLNGGEEVSVKSTTPPGANAYEPAIDCGPSGNLWVAWVEYDVNGSVGDDHLWVAQVTDTGSIRSNPLSRNNLVGDYGTDARSVEVATNSSGTVYVALWETHHQDQDRTDLYVSRYSGGVFTPLGGAVSDDYDGNNLSKPSMAFIGSDVYIAYTRANDTDYSKHVYVQKYNGSSWTQVGSGPVSAYLVSDHYDSGHPDLIAVGSDLYLAWEETDQYEGPFIYVARLTTPGSTWEIVGDKINVDQDRDALDPSLAYHSSEQALYVAFEENVAGWSQIFVKKMNLTP